MTQLPPGSWETAVSVPCSMGLEVGVPEDGSDTAQISWPRPPEAQVSPSWGAQGEAPRAGTVSAPPPVSG